METNNQLSLIIDYAHVALRELYINRVLVVVTSVVISFLVLGVGLLHNEKYQTSLTLHADSQNIIKPLLQGSASVTKIQDTTRSVKEVIHSPRLLNIAVEKAGLLDGTESPVDIERKVNALRSSLNIAGVGRSFIKISSEGSDPAQIYRSVTTVSDLFIKDAAERKRNESREAYEFIDKQVKSYKQQLQDAEEALKAFKSESIDGSESSVKARIAQLRGQIENIKLDIDEGNIRVSTIESELKSEAKFLDKQFKTDVYQERLRLVRQRLATLRLTYTDTHPDVQALQHQIDEMKNAIKNPGSASPSEDSYKAESKKADSAGNINPLYEELRSKLSDAKVEIESKKRRLSITEGLLEKEYDRLKLAAAGQAEEAELKRDYSVTKSIYEDMLERKEKARLSMTLDIEGQGMSYKVQEPANYPVSPVGLKFIHFALIGPVLGLLIPLGLIVVYVVLDPRIRFSSALQGLDGVVVLASVPHVLTPIKKRIFSWDVILLGLFILVTGSIYLAVTYARVKGML